MQTAQALLLTLPVIVHGHAYLYYPPLRGGALNNADNEYCPQCQGSSILPLPTCGKDKFLDFDGPVTTLQEVGGRVKFTVKMTAHHMGHFQFRLCDKVITSSLDGFANEEACLSEHILERVRPEEVHTDCVANDTRGDCQPFDEVNPSYWYLPPMSHGPTFSFHYRLPQGFSCEKCTLQWWWMTANSCTPHPDAYRCYFQKMQQQQWNANAWCWGACSFAGACPAVQRGAGSCGEQFKNCADVRIMHSSSSPVPSPTGSPAGPTPTHQPIAPPSPEPEAEAEQEAEEEQEQEEAGGSSSAPTAMPGMACKANLDLNRGVTDSDCKRCAEGYEWWPCNEASLCSCTPSLAEEATVSGKRARGHYFLGLIQQSDEVQKGAFGMGATPPEAAAQPQEL